MPLSAENQQKIFIDMCKGIDKGTPIGPVTSLILEAENGLKGGCQILCNRRSARFLSELTGIPFKAARASHAKWNHWSFQAQIGDEVIIADPTAIQWFKTPLEHPWIKGSAYVGTKIELYHLVMQETVVLVDDGVTVTDKEEFFRRTWGLDNGTVSMPEGWGSD